MQVEVSVKDKKKAERRYQPNGLRFSEGTSGSDACEHPGKQTNVTGNAS